VRTTRRIASNIAKPPKLLGKGKRVNRLGASCQQQFITSGQHSAIPPSRSSPKLTALRLRKRKPKSGHLVRLRKRLCSLSEVYARQGLHKWLNEQTDRPNTRKPRFAIDPLLVLQNAAAAPAFTAKKPNATAPWLRDVSSSTLSATFGSSNLRLWSLDYATDRAHFL
jgi:hypothetical protein